MTSQAVHPPETVAASRRSKITPEREREFFDAVLEQIRTCGYDAVTMEGIAASTRCSKSTLYRQWKTKPRFVAAALRASRRPLFADIDTGSLAEDLRAAARAAGELSGHISDLHQALGHAVLNDTELQQALRETLIEPEIGALQRILQRGVERGEIAADHPALAFVPAQLFGVMRVRPIMEGGCPDADYLLRFVEAAVLPALGLT
ncbi:MULTISPECIES: TetR/AcrR family transcriptional regulator [unclassified Streptomyces]|uniref:TetR/AcrR family transcriptional regulator n=1 Tax=unclassified Streptomyces TaxID=2593676 RepID=UPI0016618C38|nr:MULTISPECIES: TetR/AcrR family transcriptional regulator [unclassified Streptomyces]MBD0841309.1 TetR/AcrR family transcriptional regulator C-terminal ligand-binding domain-containing protein [Streptomyces sp. TRM68416]